MEPTRKVTVFYFQGYDITSDQIIRSKSMASLERIKNYKQGFEAIKDTAKEVNIADLDRDGHYREKKS